MKCRWDEYGKPSRLWRRRNSGTEERLEELAQAQARTEERVSKRRLTGALIEKPYMAYIFGLRVYPEVVAAAEEAGIGVLDFRGERVAAAVRS